MIEVKKNNALFNEEVNACLNSIIKKKSFANGYIFYGAEGVGKKQTALDFIKKIFKQDPLSKNIEPIVCQGEYPDLTFFLEISPEESILRRKNEIPDRMESEGIKFLEKVNKGFKIIAKEKKWEVISATQNIQNISNQIKETILRYYSDEK